MITKICITHQLRWSIGLRSAPVVRYSVVGTVFLSLHKGGSRAKALRPLFWKFSHGRRSWVGINPARWFVCFPQVCVGSLWVLWLSPKDMKLCAEHCKSSTGLFTGLTQGDRQFNRTGIWAFELQMPKFVIPCTVQVYFSTKQHSTYTKQLLHKLGFLHCIYQMSLCHQVHKFVSSFQSVGS